MKKVICEYRECDQCGTCVAVCPFDAIELPEMSLTIDQKKCTICLRCIKVCPVRALEVIDEN